MKNLPIGLALVLLCLLAQASSLHRTGFEHRSNDEYLYLKSTKEMVQSGNFLSPTFFGEDRFEKPILFYWLILASYKVLGVNWVAARCVSVAFALLTVVLTWLISREFFDRRISFLSGMLLITMPLFFAHVRTAVPDMALNFFVVLGFYALVKFVRTGRRAFSLLLFLSCALGFMIKGFPALIPLIAFVIYAVWSKNFLLLRQAGWGRGLPLLILITAPWFLFMYRVHGQVFLDHIMTHEVEHRIVDLDQGNVVWRGLGFIAHNFIYYLGILWNNLAPWSLFLLAGLPYICRRQTKETEDRVGLRLLLSCLFAVFFLFVFIAMQQYNVQYMLLASTPAAILSAYVLLLPLEGAHRSVAILRALRTFICLFVFSVGFLLFGYFVTFFSSHRALFGLSVLVVYAAAIVGARRIKDPMAAPLLLSLLIVFVTSQMAFFHKNRLSVISTLELAADAIKSDLKDQHAVVGIGGSIDPKKFWVFFEQPVEQGRLSELFAKGPRVYAVVTAYQLRDGREDGEVFAAVREGRADALPAGRYEIIWQERIMAKKMALDAGFFRALIRFDRATVERYILEDIYVIRKS